MAAQRPGRRPCLRGRQRRRRRRRRRRRWCRRPRRRRLRPLGARRQRQALQVPELRHLAARGAWRAEVLPRAPRARGAVLRATRRENRLGGRRAPDAHSLRADPRRRAAGRRVPPPHAVERPGRGRCRSAPRAGEKFGHDRSAPGRGAPPPPLEHNCRGPHQRELEEPPARGAASEALEFDSGKALAADAPPNEPSSGEGRQAAGSLVPEVVRPLAPKPYKQPPRGEGTAKRLQPRGGRPPGSHMSQQHVAEDACSAHSDVRVPCPLDHYDMTVRLPIAVPDRQRAPNAACTAGGCVGGRLRFPRRLQGTSNDYDRGAPAPGVAAAQYVRFSSSSALSRRGSSLPGRACCALRRGGWRCDSVRSSRREDWCSSRHGRRSGGPCWRCHSV